MNDQWTSRLSDYLDEELGAGERSACEAHLASCAECRAALADLRRVVARAQALSDAPPAADLWPGVEAGLGRRTVLSFQTVRRFRLSLTLPQAAAAALVLAAISGALVWLAQPRGGAERSEAALGAPAVPVAIARAGFADESYDHAIADLERALADRRPALDPQTVATIERSLQAVDRAIADARRALEADPGNLYLNGYFAATRRRKLDLLRQASALARIES
jgi:anti-sigma factor RsiW